MTHRWNSTFRAESPHKHLGRSQVALDRSNGSKRPARRRKRHSGIKIDLADKYFSLFIRFRANWTCEYCGTQYEVGSQGLHCSHFWSRGREATRFDPANASAHCFSCHVILGGNPELHREWKLQRIGEQAYILLRIRAESRCKKDRKAMAIVCKQLYLTERTRYETEQK